MIKLQYILLLFLLSSILTLTIKAQAIQHQVDLNGVKITSGDNILLQSIPNKWWGIATNWQNDWPADWRFINPDSIEIVNSWTILHGKSEILGKGSLMVRDAFKIENNRIKCIRRWTWKGIDTLRKVTLSVQFLTPGKGKQVFMPGIQYYGNPSGEKSGNTPWYHGEIGDRAIYEEHRFPMPFVSFEFNQNNKIYGTAFHSLPTPIQYGNKLDQWWSLGCERIATGTILQLLSGPCASNQQQSVVKARQSGTKHWESYNNVWLDLPPGAVIEKTFYLQAYSDPDQVSGNAFRPALRTSIELFDPVYFNGLPPMKEIVLDKYQFAKTRWIKDKGFNQFDPQFEKGAFIVIGWVGQAAALGFALQTLSHQIKDSEIPEMIQTSLDLVSTSEFYEEGFRTWYSVQDQQWGDRIWKPKPEWLSQGQGMFNLANAIKQGRFRNYYTEKWEVFLQKAADFHAERILSKDWNPKSTNEAFFIAPLSLAYQIFEDKHYLQAAQKAGDYYLDRHIDMKEPYWGGTLDAKCEDKEGAFGAFQAFLYLYEATGEKRYLAAAEHACDVMLSYTYIWDVDLPAGRLRDHQFKSRGWTSVSVQNMHLDVYGVLLAPFVYRLGQLKSDDTLKELALLMYRSCGQIVDPYGSQGEQIQQTNYTQGKEDSNFANFRGGYVEDWTVFWITAHFLTAAALFEDFGLSID